MPSVTSKEDVLFLISPSLISSACLAVQSFDTSPPLLSSVSHPLIVTESSVGRLLSIEGQRAQILEKFMLDFS
jgi:hypothetical protein